MNPEEQDNQENPEESDSMNPEEEAHETAVFNINSTKAKEDKTDYGLVRQRILEEEMQESYLDFVSSRRRHTRCYRDWSSDVCSSDLEHTSDLQKTAYEMLPLTGVQTCALDRKSAVSGKRGELGGARIMNKTKTQ